MKKLVLMSPLTKLPISNYPHFCYPPSLMSPIYTLQDNQVVSAEVSCRTPFLNKNIHFRSPANFNTFFCAQFLTQVISYPLRHRVTHYRSGKRRKSRFDFLTQHFEFPTFVKFNWILEGLGQYQTLCTFHLPRFLLPKSLTPSRSKRLLELHALDQFGDFVFCFPSGACELYMILR